jgi:hypothetical protein
MAANSSVSLVSLDHDTLKAELKNFLKTQSAFRDYDYEGSNMNVLLDVLAYNTFQNAFYLNMMGSEMFMDSAQMRDSVVSHAKDLNYLPRSMKSSVATVNAYFTTVNNMKGLLQIPKGTQFSGINDLGSYVFTTDKTYTYSSSNGYFAVEDLKLYEGTYSEDSYLMDYTNEAQQFLLTDSTIDTDSLSVYVYENDGADVNEFTRASNLYGLTSTSNIYFLQATTKGRYEVLFGDNQFGRRPLNNATIVFQYRVCSGASGDNVKTIACDQQGTIEQINGYGISDLTITTVVPSIGGADAESIERIRYNAPRHYQTQDRAITTNDYKNLILENYPEINSVNVFGGEDITGSIEYGSVYISTTTFNGSPISTPRKNDILDFLNERSAIGISTKIIDPDYIYVFGQMDVNVDLTQTKLTAAQLTTAVINGINTYNDDTLKQFGSVYRNSRLISALEAIDPSIQSVVFQPTLKKIVSPPLNVSSAISVNFNNNELVPSNIISSQFMIGSKTYVLTDYNPNNNTFGLGGTPTTFYITNSSSTIYLKEISTENVQNYTAIPNAINYTKGTIDVQGLQISSFLEKSGIEFYVTPYYDDIFAIKNDVIEMDVNNINITIYKDNVKPIVAQ